MLLCDHAVMNNSPLLFFLRHYLDLGVLKKTTWTTFTHHNCSWSFVWQHYLWNIAETHNFRTLLHIFLFPICFIARSPVATPLVHLFFFYDTLHLIIVLCEYCTMFSCKSRKCMKQRYWSSVFKLLKFSVYTIAFTPFLEYLTKHSSFRKHK